MKEGAGKGRGKWFVIRFDSEEYNSNEKEGWRSSNDDGLMMLVAVDVEYEE
jgi:hypothetical protein